jgi:hypothetical protein
MVNDELKDVEAGEQFYLNRKTHVILVRNSLRLSPIDNSLTFI